nr:serine/threonine protein kinase [Deltaproteobacteria bacterium]
MAAVVRVEDQEVTRDLRAVTTIDREGPHGDEATRVLPEPVVGARVGRYEITGRLGAGGMGVVLAAHDARLDRGVALKLLRRDRAPLGAAWSEGRARLLREAQAMAQLSHPNVVEVYDVGVAQDSLYIAMERIDGGTLRAWLAEHRPGWAAVTRIFVQAGRGLAAAHAADLIHRDFKPSNVLIDRHQRARVVDFGLALPTVGRVRPESGPLPAANWVDGRLMVSVSGATDRLSAPVTEAGMVMGTPAYMAPEQHLGGEVGPVADQFAFCASLFEGLYGQRPFMGGTARELLRVKKSGPPPPPTSTRVPRAVHQIVARGLRPHAEHRWPSMTALLDALEAAVSPRGKHGARLAVGAVVMVSAAAVVVANGATGGADTETVACASQADRMDVAWDDGRRRTLRHTLSEVGAGYAVDTAERVDRHLDDYRARWEQQLANVCGSTPRDKHEWTRREEQLACLERRRRRMATTVEVLMGTDAKLLPQAIALVKGLPSVEQCAVSTAPADMTLPDDPVVAAR